MLKYKKNILYELKKAGFTTYIIRKDNILGENTLTALRHNRPISWASLNTLCALLRCQPGDLLEHVPDDPQE